MNKIEAVAVTGTLTIDCHAYHGFHNAGGAGVAIVHRGNAVVAANKIDEIAVASHSDPSFPVDVDHEGGPAERGIHITGTTNGVAYVSK